MLLNFLKRNQSGEEQMSEIDDEHEEFPQENLMQDTAEVYTVPDTGHLESSPVYLRNARYYLEKTGHMTFVEQGAFVTLLDLYNVTQGPLPLNTKKLFRLCRAFDHEEKISIVHIVETYFEKTDSGYIPLQASTQM